jgi:hypothetical protein
MASSTAAIISPRNPGTCQRTKPGVAVDALCDGPEITIILHWCFSRSPTNFYFKTTFIVARVRIIYS